MLERRFVTLTGAILLDRDIYIEPNTGCWLWLRDVVRNGYGRLWKEHKMLGERLVHRAVYKLVRGDIPHAMQLDHICRTRSCCNPNHLRIVTPRENSKAGYLANPGSRHKPHEFCKRGHALTPENRFPSKPYGCRTCAHEKYVRKGKI
jgi:hypothetical protein